MIKIVADTAADISKNEVDELSIEVIPFVIHIDGKEVLADVNLDPNDYYDMVENCNEIPSTSQMSPEDLEKIYRKLGKEDTIIHITMSAKASGINSTANILSRQLNDEGFDITVIDSNMLSYTIGYAVVEAAKMARDGKSKKEIIDYVTEVYNRDTAYFIVDDLSYLRKSGRIKATSMAISKVLDIKPILNVNDGMVEAFKKVRGTKKALATLVDYIEDRMDCPEENEVIILSSKCDDKVDFIKQLINEKLKVRNIREVSIGPIITTHAGVGVLGVYFKHKKPYTEYENK